MTHSRFPKFFHHLLALQLILQPIVLASHQTNRALAAEAPGRVTNNNYTHSESSASAKNDSRTLVPTTGYQAIPQAAGSSRILNKSAANASESQLQPNIGSYLPANGVDAINLYDVVCPSTGDLVVANGESCYWEAGTYAYNSVTVQNGGIITALGNTTTHTGVTVYANTMTLADGGLLASSGKGYASASGPGAGVPAGLGASAGGGGHGGWGGDSTTPGGDPYGDVYQPTTLGSGGGSRGVAGGAGGGAIHLVITNTIAVSGTIESNGTVGGESYGGTGGGAGGSIWIEAATATGSGLITANGGNGVLSGFGGAYGYGGGGAGGRIALDVQTSGFSGTVRAYGGEGGQDGGPGTVYWASEDRLVVTDQSDPGASSAVMPGNYAFSEIEIFNQATLTFMGTNSVVTATQETLTSDGTGMMITSGQLSLPSTFVLEDLTLDLQGSYVGLDDLQLGNQGRLILRASTPLHSGPYDLNTLTVGPSGRLTLIPANDGDSDYSDDSPLHLFAEMISIAAGGLIESDGHGYAGTTSNGAGPGGGLGDSSLGYRSGGGGGYGGSGGDGSDTYYGGSIYGDIFEPARLGSAGGAGAVASTAYRGADGGGAIHLEVNQNLNVDGILSANGAAGDGRSSPAAGGAGGGSGGSIWISAQQMTGTGEIQANGGSSIYAGGGGGGRIAIYADTLDPGIGLFVDGGTGTSNGSVGSISTGTVIAQSFTASLSADHLTLNTGGQVQTTLHLTNIGWLPEQYDIALSGIDPSWVALEPEQVGLAVGQSEDILITITPPGCELETTIPFTVTVNSSETTQQKILTGDLSLVQSPQILIDSPGDGITSGAQSVLFQWRTAPETTGRLSLYPAGQPEQTQLYTTTITNTASVQVDNLVRNETYRWSVQADSACGTTTTSERSFMVGNGIVFVERNPTHVIHRDYNQIINVTVRNDDVLSHTLLATVQNPYEDLIVNFVGSGSVDETIELGSGESRSVSLAVHAQDATLSDYDLVAVITADDGTATPLIDTTRIHVRPLAEFQVTVNEVGVDAVTGTRTYRVTNQGLPIADLEIGAVDPTSGEPARVYLTPNIDHARLDTDQSIEVKAVPLYGSDDVANPAGIEFDLTVEGSGNANVTPAALSCPSGQIYPVTLDNACLPIHASNWYCTNRPKIQVPFWMPYFIDPGEVSSADLSVSFNPQTSTRPHDTSFFMNDVPIGGFQNIVPFGTFWTGVPASALNSGDSGPVVQRLNVDTVHPNGGHYVVASEFTLGIELDSVTAYVCASSAEEAESVVQSTYGFESLSSSSACQISVIPGESRWSSTADGCVGSTYQADQATEGGPINTRTGNYDYSVTDLSIDTLSGPLSFQRWYASLASGYYTSTLGYGWTHNLDTRLIFPDDPGGQEGTVYFKVHSANLYKFDINVDGTYTALAGICGNLTRNEGTPVTYTFVDSTQKTYTFDESGRLTTLTDSAGHNLYYEYDPNSGRLSRVSDESGQRYIALNYDAQGRIQTVSDHGGRQVTFGYDPATGDLVSATDVHNQTWTYQYTDVNFPHYLTQMADPRQTILERTEYNAQGLAVRQYNGQGELVVELEYDGLGSAKVRDGLGNESLHVYNSRNALEDQKDPAGAQTSKIYDGNFRATSITDPLNHTTNLVWSVDGYNLEQIQDAAGNTTRMTYDDLNNLTSIVDSRGIITTYTYSGTLLLSSTDGLGHTTRYAYTTGADAPQPSGLLKTITDPLGNTTTYTYDQYGQRIAVTDASNRTTWYAYDDLGRLQTVTGPQGRTNWTCYDPAGRVVRTVANASGDGGTPQTDPCDAANYVPGSNPDQDRVTTTVYDEAGNAIARIDPSGRITRTYYDDANRPVTVVQNLVGQGIETATPPTRDPANPDQNVRSDTVYDAAGNPIATIDPAGVITRTYYDANNRPATTVGNLTGQAIEVNTPPARNPANPDQNIRSDTVYDAAGNPIAAIDPLGAITRTYYDELNRAVTVVQNLTGQAIEASTPPGRDPNNPDQNLRSDTVYDEAGNPVATIDPSGKITRTYYDEANRLVTVVQNLSGQGIEVTTPPSRNPSIPDQNVRADTIYDDAGNPIATVDPLGVVTRTYYDGNDRHVTVVQNLVGQAIETASPPARNPAVADENLRTDTIYDEGGIPIAAVDPLGFITRTFYDGLDRPVSVVQNLMGQAVEVTTPPARNPANPDENVRTDSVYDTSGNAIASIDPLGKVTRTYFDGLSRPVTTVQNLVGQAIEASAPPSRDPAHPDQNARTDLAYDLAGNTIAATGPLGKINRTYFDGLERRLSVVQNLTGQAIEAATPPARDPANPDQNVRTDTTYDAAGNSIATTDPLGVILRTYYDGAYRPVTAVQNLVGQGIEVSTPPARDPGNPDQNARSDTGYDVLGNRVSLADPDSVVTRFEYDGMNRLAAVVENYRPGFNPDQETNVRTEYAYDANGNRSSILDANGHSTTFEYDALGRLVSESDALNHTTSYTYDAGSRRTATTNANGATTTFAYDALGRLVGIDYPSPDADVSFTYDAVGQRLSMGDGLGSTAWSYDGLSRVASVTDPFNGTVGYGYDLSGNRTGLTYPDGKSVSYGYDGANRLAQVTGWDTSVTTYTYDSAGRQVSVSLPNGVTSSYNYDSLGRLLALTHAAGMETLSSYEYTYDPAGNRTQLVETLALPGSVALNSNSTQVAMADPAETSMVFGTAPVKSGEVGLLSAPLDLPGQGLASMHKQESAPASIDFARLPLAFVPNLGQTDQAVRFQVKSLGGTIFFTPQEVVLAILNPLRLPDKHDPEKMEVVYDRLPPTIVRLNYSGANPQPEIAPAEALPGVVHYLTGSDPDAWITDIPTYAGVVYRELYPGVDLRYEGTEGHLKSLYHVSPGADPAAIRWRYNGSTGVSVDEAGDLVISLPSPGPGGPEERTTIVERAPLAWQEVDGERLPVSVQYAVEPDHTVSFVLPEGYDPDLPLVIDPELTYSTYLGGTKEDDGHAITVDGEGNAYVAGRTYSSNFPLANPVMGDQPTKDVFISKLNPAGDTLLYSTYIGGSGGDTGHSIALDSAGRIAIAGETESTDFPAVGGYDTTAGGGTCDGAPCDDGFVLQLAPDGSAIRYSSYIGGSLDDEGYFVAVDGNGYLYTVGELDSADMPTLNPYQAGQAGSGDAYFVVVDPAQSGGASLLYATYLGGDNGDVAYGVQVGSDGKAYLAGYTRSSDFPARNAYQAARAGNRDAFVAKFDPLAGGDASLLYSTFLGGSGDDRGFALALSAPDQVFVTGRTQSGDFPLASAYDSTYAGGTCGTRSCYDVFVFHLDLATNTLVYSTYLGGSVDEEGLAIAASSSGSAYLTGYTKSTDFPVLDAIQEAKGAESCAAPPCEDAFVTKLDASGSALVYSTYLGGGGDDQGNGIALDGEGGVYVAGEGNSVDFPVTPGAYDTTLNGTKDDAFIVKIGEAAPPPSSWTTTYTYTYDPLYRLAGATYSSGEFFEYTYDAAGNRLSETTHLGTTTYTYDNANRLTDVNGVTYTWDDNGNLLSDGVNTYTYDHANRLTSVVGPSSSSSYAYNGLGDRLQGTVDGVTTNYTLDLNNWLTQVLADGTNAYLYGATRIAQYDASGAEYFLADALGSVRQLVDNTGGVQMSKVYEPFGGGLNSSGAGATNYGFTGEWTDPTGLVYLRARYYTPYLNQFIQLDPIVANPHEPWAWDRYTYSRNNPVNYKDPSGLSPIVDCSQWANPILAKLCKASNGNDNDPATLDAREQLFAAIAYGGTLRGVIGSGWRDPNDIGYLWAAVMLVHFLDGNGSKMNIIFSASDPFVNDPGITRATRSFGEPSSGDETDFIIPLLHSFLTNHVEPNADVSGNSFTVKPVKLFGQDHYFNDPSKQRGLEPRARSQGFWAAFGHVVIDGTFSAKGKFSCKLEGYLINYSAEYLIEDHYGWFAGIQTPFPFGHGGSTVWIPHEWELSLVQAGRAAEYDFTISWIERDRLLVEPDFSQYTQAHWWDWYW